MNREHVSSARIVAMVVVLEAVTVQNVRVIVLEVAKHHQDSMGKRAVVLTQLFLYQKLERRLLA